MNNNFSVAEEIFKALTILSEAYKTAQRDPDFPDEEFYPLENLMIETGKTYQQVREYIDFKDE